MLASVSVTTPPVHSLAKAVSGSATATNVQSVGVANSGLAGATGGSASGNGILLAGTRITNAPITSLAEGGSVHGGDSSASVDVVNNATVTNTGTAVASAGPAGATGQVGSNTVSGVVDGVDAASGAQSGSASAASGTSIVTSGDVLASNTQVLTGTVSMSAISSTGDASADGIQSSLTNIDNALDVGVSTGGAKDGATSAATLTFATTDSVDTLGSARAGTGAALALGQVGNNSLTGLVTTVDAAGGGSAGGSAGMTIALNRQLFAAIEEALAQARSGSASIAGIDTATDITTDVNKVEATGGASSGVDTSVSNGSNNNVHVTNTGSAAGQTGDAAFIAQDGDNTATVTNNEVGAVGGGNSGGPGSRALSGALSSIGSIVSDLVDHLRNTVSA